MFRRLRLRIAAWCWAKDAAGTHGMALHYHYCTTENPRRFLACVRELRRRNTKPAKPGCPFYDPIIDGVKNA